MCVEVLIFTGIVQESSTFCAQRVKTCPVGTHHHQHYKCGGWLIFVVKVTTVLIVAGLRQQLADTTNLASSSVAEGKPDRVTASCNTEVPSFTSHSKELPLSVFPRKPDMLRLSNGACLWLTTTTAVTLFSRKRDTLCLSIVAWL